MKGEFDGESAAFVGFAFYFDLAAVGSDDLIGDKEAHAESVVFLGWDSSGESGKN